ncbi:beta-galactosidase domain 4-containing protein [Streptomyces sp. NPDC002758]
MPVLIRNAAAHWAAIESTPALQGGFIWESWDHGIVQRVSDGRPAGRAGSVSTLDHRRPFDGDFELVAPVRIKRYKHEGIVLCNHQQFRGLDWLAARWELVVADGRTLTAPAELPDLLPGQTAAMPLPFELPRDGGDAWLTLRVTTAEDQPWAPRGTEICASQVRLRMAAPAGLPAAAGRVVQLHAPHRVHDTAGPAPETAPTPTHLVPAAVRR